VDRRRKGKGACSAGGSERSAKICSTHTGCGESVVEEGKRTRSERGALPVAKSKREKPQTWLSGSASRENTHSARANRVGRGEGKRLRREARGQDTKKTMDGGFQQSGGGNVT